MYLTYVHVANLVWNHESSLICSATGSVSVNIVVVVVVVVGGGDDDDDDDVVKGSGDDGGGGGVNRYCGGRLNRQIAAKNI